VDSSLDEARAALGAIDPSRREAAAAYLSAHPGPAACLALLPALDDTDAQVREAVIVALSRQNPDDCLRPLAGLLHEDRPGRRNAAYSTLLEIGVRAPETLAAALHDGDEVVRAAMAEILGNLRAPVAVAGLVDCLRRSAEPAVVQQAAAAALGRIGDRAAVPALIETAASSSPAVRTAAIQALGHLDDERAVPLLLDLMQRDATRLPFILEALGNIGRPEAIAPIAAVLATQPADSHTGAAALEALIRIVIEPESGRREETDRLAEARRLIPTAPLLLALQKQSAPGNAYAAHLLGWLTPPEALPQLVAALDHTADVALRDAATEAILRYGRAAIGPLTAGLAHPDALLRESAANLLGMLGDASLAPVLLTRLNDEDLAVRQAVLHALGSVGGESAYAGLLQAMEDPATQDTVLGIIGQTRDIGLIGNLQQALYHGQAAVRRGAAQALSLLSDEAAVSVLLNATREPEEAIRQPAAEALAQVRGNRAIDVLIEALGDRDWLVRQKAVQALSCIPDGRAVAALLPVAHDPEWRVRHTLVQVLGRIKDVRLFIPLQDLAHDPDEWIRRDAMARCAVIDDSQAVEILVHGLQDTALSVRRAALTALGYQRAPDAAAAVAECLTDSSPAIRVAAARTLANLAVPMAVEKIGMLVDDPVEEVRLEAVEALGQLGLEESLGALEILLQNEALAVRRRAAEALARLGTTAAIETLVSGLSHPLAKGPAQAQLQQLGPRALRALLRAARSSQPELRAVAAATLGQMPVTRAQITPTLEVLRKDPDQRVRAAAQEALFLLDAR
jgi:HEAT repeat protein